MENAPQNCIDKTFQNMYVNELERSPNYKSFVMMWDCYEPQVKIKLKNTPWNCIDKLFETSVYIILKDLLNISPCSDVTLLATIICERLVNISQNFEAKEI